MLDLHVYLTVDDYDFKKKNPSFGPPPPITKLTMEQDLKMRLIEDRLKRSGEVNKDVVTVF